MVRAGALKLGWEVVVLGLCLAVPAPALTVIDIPKLVKSQNEEVRTASQDAEAADWGVASARSRFFPSLVSRTYFVHLGSEISANIPTQSFSLGSLATVSIDLPPVEVHRQDYYLSNIVMKMPIYAGGRIWAAYDAAKAQADEARSEHAKVIEEKTRETLERYFQVQLARNISQTLEEMRENLDRIRQISEGLVKSGLGAKFSTLQVKVAQADLHSRLSEARGKAALADLAFKNAIGQGAAAAVEYDSPLKKLPLPDGIETFKKQAIQKRREFALLKAKKEQVEALKTIKTGQMLPALYALGAYRVASTPSPIEMPSWAVGAILEIPITGFLEAIPERQRAVQLEQKVEILNSRATQEIPLQVEKIYSEVESSHAAYEANEEGTEMAREALRLAEVRFKSGDGSAVEVLRASTDLEKSNVRKLQLTEEFNRNLIGLFWAGGDVTHYLEAYQGQIK